MTPPDTIFALSSGRPPAGIAVVRISGRQAGSVLEALAGVRPEPRRVRTADLKDPSSGELLDRALILWMPGPVTTTGDDVAELHLHGGRAVVDAVLQVLGGQPGLRAAVAGEFTRRAFDNGRIDLNEADGLADLLAAETASQRRAALTMAGGALSRTVEDWRARLLIVAASIEAAIDYSDEDDVDGSQMASARAKIVDLAREMDACLARPSVERLRDGVRVVVAGPPNSGKSSLVNALSGRDAAIESPVAGTTRDLVEVPIAMAGVPMILVDTAGLRDAADAVEAAGVARAMHAAHTADIILWLGDDNAPVEGVVVPIHARADIRPPHPDRLAVSARTGLNLPVLMEQIAQSALALLPMEGDVSLNRRQRDLVEHLATEMRFAFAASDPLLLSEHVRLALRRCDQIVGRAGVEDMLDALFSRFCIGK